MRWGRFFCMIGDQEVVIKFFRKGTSGQGKTEVDGFRKIKQGFFMLSAVHTLGLAPKPYGYLLGEKAKTLASNAGLDYTDYYGAIAMERIRPKFESKSQDVGLRKPLPFDSRIKKLFSSGLDTLSEIGFVIDDIDFVVDDRNHFYFIDLDSWLVRSDSGFWQNGALSEDRWSNELLKRMSESYKHEISNKLFRNP